MKRILLASASIVAFAGAAAAEVSFGGSATLGYNDEEEDGFFVESDLGVTFAQELNNGLRAGVTFNFDIEDDNEAEGGNVFGDDDLGVDDFVLFLESDQGGLYFGDTAYAAETHWDGDAFFGSLAADDFSEQDGETVIRGDTTFGDVGASVSYNIADADGDSADDVDQLSLGASGAISTFTFAAAYQEESDAVNQPVGTAEDPDEEDTSVEGLYDTDDDDDFSTDEVFAISAGTTFSGADVRLAYANNTSDEESSLGVAARYPFGPVSVTAYYTLEMSDLDNDPGTEEDESDPDDSYGIAASYANGPFTVAASYESEQGDEVAGVDVVYDTGTGLVLNAGFYEDLDEDDEEDNERYVAAIYELGEDAFATLSYSEEEDGGLDDQYKEGTTASVTFTF